MAQNVYDRNDFFEGYGGLPRSVQGLDGAAEWPTLRTLVPALDGARVLDLGCGFGWFCRWAADEGAADVLGVDLSENMLGRAVADTAQPQVRYARHDLDALTLEALDVAAASLDLVYSSLTFHYVVELDRLFGQAAAGLRAGGAFVFSVEHPIFMAPRHPAFVAGPQGSPVWPLDGYLDEGPRTTDWLAPGVVKQHRTIGTYVELLVRNGFVVDRVVEWGPDAEQVAAHPEWAVEVERPPFLLVAAHRA